MVFDFSLISPELLQAFFAVVAIDLVLAGDNAVVIGLAAAGLEKQQRAKAILIGIIFATVLRIAFALVAAELLLIIGLLLACSGAPAAEAAHLQRAAFHVAALRAMVPPAPSGYGRWSFRISEASGPWVFRW